MAPYDDFYWQHEREERLARERKLDLLSYAKRHNLAIRWRHSGVPGTPLEPFLVRPGSEIELPFPGERRR